LFVYNLGASRNLKQEIGKYHNCWDWMARFIYVERGIKVRENYCYAKNKVSSKENLLATFF